MRPSYPTVENIELQIASGQGLAVICEGETVRQDQAILEWWFQDLATEVSFFAQDGWPAVDEAVSELRRRKAPLPVFGLVDRDFADDATLDAQESDGYHGFIYRLPWCTIENGLLDPLGWSTVVRKLHVRGPAIPAGWDTPEALTARILECYRQSVPGAAYNWCVSELDRRCRSLARFTEARYATSVEVGDVTALRQRLRTWSMAFGEETAAHALFDQRLAELQGLQDASRLGIVVSGKLVLSHLQQALPVPQGRQRPRLDELVDRYLAESPTPPDQLARLLHLLLARGRQERAR